MRLPDLLLLNHFETDSRSRWDFDYPFKMYGDQFGALESPSIFLGSKSLLVNFNGVQDPRAYPYFNAIAGKGLLSIGFAFRVAAYSPTDLMLMGIYAPAVSDYLIKIGDFNGIFGNDGNLFAEAINASGVKVRIETAGLNLQWGITYWLNLVISANHIYLYVDDVLVADAAFSGLYNSIGYNHELALGQDWYNLNPRYYDELIICANANQILKPTAPFTAPPTKDKKRIVIPLR